MTSFGLLHISIFIYVSQVECPLKKLLEVFTLKYKHMFKYVLRNYKHYNFTVLENVIQICRKTLFPITDEAFLYTYFVYETYKI